MSRSSPDLRQIVFPHAQQIDSLSAGQLDQRYVIPLGDVGDAPQLRGAGDAAGNLRHHGERSVLLDVGVDALVDEARVLLVFVLTVPQRLQQRGEARLARGVFLAARQDSRRPRKPISNCVREWRGSTQA